MATKRPCGAYYGTGPDPFALTHRRARFTLARPVRTPDPSTEYTPKASARYLLSGCPDSLTVQLHERKLTHVTKPTPQRKMEACLAASQRALANGLAHSAVAMARRAIEHGDAWITETEEATSAAG